MQLLTALLMATLLNGFILLLLRKRYDGELYRFVALCYVGTILLRYSLAVYMWLHYEEANFNSAFWGDSQTYDTMGAALAESWSQGASIRSWRLTLEGQVNRGFIYFVACVYYLFGRNVLLVQFLNGIIGALTPIAILEIGLAIYDRRVARTAMLLTAYFPQMIFWSTALYKDPAVMLCIALNILAVVRLRQRLGVHWISVYLLTSFGLVWLRFYIFYATAAAAAVGIFMRHRRGVTGLASQVALVSAMIVLLLYTPLGQEVRLQARFLDLQVLSTSRIDLARAGSGFASEADVSTIGGVVSLLPLGVVHLLFAPFPWTVSNLRQALALPDVLMWYALVPALIRGVYFTRSRMRETMPILVFTTALTLAYGAFLGNVGTAYRQRTQIMMFYFLFIADGIHRRERRTPGNGPVQE
jgi:hypothetical protein